jgi:hypothetical protein
MNCRRTFFIFMLVLTLFSCGQKGKTGTAPAKTEPLSVFWVRKTALKTDTLKLDGYVFNPTEKCSVRHLNYTERGTPMPITFLKTCPSDTMNKYLVQCMTEKYGIVEQNDVRNKTLYVLKTNNDSINDDLSRILDFIYQNPL